MKETDIKITQLEKSDISLVKDFLNGDFKAFINDYKEYDKADVEAFLNFNNSHSTISFAIRKSESIYKDYLVGICALRNIDWISRHSEIFFIMIDKDGIKASMHNRPASKQAFALLLDLSFNEFNLNKVWMCVNENNNIINVIEEFGFVADGIARSNVFKNGKFIDSMICSLTQSEYRNNNGQ